MNHKILSFIFIFIFCTHSIFANSKNKISSSLSDTELVLASECLKSSDIYAFVPYKTDDKNMKFWAMLNSMQSLKLFKYLGLQNYVSLVNQDVYQSAQLFFDLKTTSPEDFIHIVKLMLEVFPDLKVKCVPNFMASVTVVIGGKILDYDPTEIEIDLSIIDDIEWPIEFIIEDDF